MNSVHLKFTYIIINGKLIKSDIYIYMFVNIHHQQKTKYILVTFSFIYPIHNRLVFFFTVTNFNKYV